MRSIRVKIDDTHPRISYLSKFQSSREGGKNFSLSLPFPDTVYIFICEKSKIDLWRTARNETIELSIYANKRTCAFLNKPPVEPPKIGDGVFGSNFGADHAGAASPSARTTND